MMFTQFCIWWYGRGWHDVVHSLSRRLGKTAESFSVKLLLRTLFAPWRRIISYPGASLNDHFHAWLDNMVSRVIGFFVRFFVLVAAAFTMLGILVLTILEIVLWPCIPIAVIAVIIIGVVS